MGRQRKDYHGKINKLLTRRIYINVNFLEEGNYEIVITHQNKVIKSVRFNKTKKQS